MGYDLAAFSRRLISRSMASRIISSRGSPSASTESIRAVVPSANGRRSCSVHSFFRPTRGAISGTRNSVKAHLFRVHGIDRITGTRYNFNQVHDWRCKMTGLTQTLECPACGRDFGGDHDLMPGMACPSDDCPSNENNWYRRRDELEPEMIFESCWGTVKLDRRVPGDGSKWYVANWLKGYTQGKTVVADHWSYEDSTIEPGDLTARLPDDWAGA